MKNKDKNNSEFIKKSTSYGIAIFIVLSVGIFFLFQGSKEIGILSKNLLEDEAKYTFLASWYLLLAGG